MLNDLSDVIAVEDVIYLVGFNDKPWGIFVDDEKAEEFYCYLKKNCVRIEDLFKKESRSFNVFAAGLRIDRNT